MPSRGIATCLLLIGLTAAPAAAQPLVMQAAPTDRILILRFSPKGAPPKDSIAQTLDAAESALASRARLTVASTERTGIGAAEADACPVERRFLCWTRLAARDPLVRYLLILAVQPLEAGVSSWTPLFFDLELAHAIEARAAATPEERERALHDVAVRLGPRRVLASDPIADHFAAIFDELQPTFEASGFAGGFGVVNVGAVDIANRLILDGRPLGDVPAGAEVRIEEVRPGAHALLAQAESARAEVRFEIGPWETRAVQLTFSRSGTRRHPARTITELGGIVLVVGGAALVTGSRLVQADAEPGVSIALGPSSIEPEPASVPFAVGFGLAAAGSVCALGSVLFGDDAEAPWWSILAGVVAGAGTTAILLAAEAR